MFSPTLQLILALVCVSAAVLFLAYRAGKWLRGRAAGCGSKCAACPSNSRDNRVTPLVPLELPPLVKKRP